MREIQLVESGKRHKLMVSDENYKEIDTSLTLAGILFEREKENAAFNSLTITVVSENCKDVLSRPAEEFDNDKQLEYLWAEKAYDHNEVYFNLLCSVDTKQLRITPIDDLIYTEFRKEFPKLEVKIIDENHLKSTEEKAKWRPFCERFRDVLEDYSFGTLLRANAEEDNRPENTILVTKIQFCCIEITRNREGVNSVLRKKFRNDKDASSF